MGRKIRITLLIIFLFLFLIIAPTAILYSQGYRFNFENKKIEQTGGFFVKAEPKQVEIYVDGKLKKKTDFFLGSALIQNLLPKKHNIEIKKEDYLPWQKNLEIREKEVTAVKNLVLFPENLSFTILSPQQKDIKVENFWFSPDGKKIILKETTASEEKTNWALKLYDLEKNIKSHLISKVEIGSEDVGLINLEFSSDSTEIYLDLKIKEQRNKFDLKLDEIPPKLVKKEVVPPLENILCSAIKNQDFYKLDKAGYLFKNGAKLNQTPFLVSPKTECVLKTFQDFLFLIEGEDLYLFSLDSKSFEKFFEKVNDLKISPNNQKLAIFSNSEIWVLFLADDGVKKAGEKLFLVRLSEKIDDIFWVNSDYLMFNSGNNIKIVELDDRDKIQVWNIANFPNPKIYFNQTNKKLYILSNEKLFASSPLF